MADATLVRDRTAALYIYEETADGHVQRGLVGGVGLARADAGIVLPHEDTMAGPVSDRLALSVATQANLEPIFLVYEGGGAASALVAAADQRTPLLDTTTADGIRHRIWAIEDPAELDAIAADLLGRKATIADGHHRYANYLRYQADRRAEGAGDGPWDYGLTLLVDMSVFGPQVHPIHRVIPSLPAAAAAEAAASAFTVTPTNARGEELLEVLAKAGAQGPAFCVADEQSAWLLTEPDRGGRSSGASGRPLRGMARAGCLAGPPPAGPPGMGIVGHRRRRRLPPRPAGCAGGGRDDRHRAAPEPDAR